ncbi:hypothetical protein HY636_00165 [Candidatus Woesearchaeota archaeon]|nr:hypothetical protein [Candidatus Woesearchaeota archaeon]
MKKRFNIWKNKTEILWFGVIFIITIVLLVATDNMNNLGITGKVTYTGGTYSCTTSSTGKTYQKCMYATLSKGETIMTGVPWASKTITGAAGFIRDNVPGANVNQQVNAWIDLTDWLNNKIYDNTPDAFKNLNWYAKKDGTTKILIGWNYKISDSAWGNGWKWIDVYYDYYYENDGREFKKYSSSSSGFYYNSKTNEISH